MRKTQNLWMFISIEIFLAGASEVGYWKAQGLPTGGQAVRKGFGRSPKQARINALYNTIRKGNTDTSTILYDHVFLKNGKVVFRAKDGDKLINNNGLPLVPLS